MNNLVFPNMQPFKFWCQMALPTVLDDSLSYYEVLNKVVKNLNIINDNMTDLAQSMVEPYDPDKVYYPGDYVWNEGKLYKCIAITSSAWDFTKWEEKIFTKSIADDFKNLTETVDGNIENFNTLINTAIYSIATSYDNTHSYAVGDYVTYIPDAEEYDESNTYSSGEFCIHDSYIYQCISSTTGTWDHTKWKIAGVLYKCTSATTGNFDPTKWTSKIIITELFDYAVAQWQNFLDNYYVTQGLVNSLGDSETDGITQKAATDGIINASDKLLDGFYNFESKITTSAFEQGGIRSNNGANSAATNRLRSSAYIKVNNIAGFIANSSYKYCIFIYTGTAYTSYVGTYNINGDINTNANWQEGNTFISGVDKSYYIKILLSKKDDSDITPETVDPMTIVYSTDRELKNIGQPADAKSVGDAIKPSNDALFNNTPFINTAYYEHNMYISQGEWVTGSNFVSLIIPVEENHIKITTFDHANSIAFLKTFDPSQSPDFSDDPDWDINKVIEANTSVEVDSPEDAAYLYIYVGNRLWYPMLEIDGFYYSLSIADNFSEIRDELKTYNSSLIKEYYNHSDPVTSNGITYYITNGKIHYQGTATANVFIALEGSVSSKPAWAQNGRYYAKIDKDLPDNVKYQLSRYQTGASTSTFCSSTVSTNFYIANVDTYNGIISRFLIPKGETVNNTASVTILSNVPNSDLSNSNYLPVKIRLMQYNAGKFNMGKKIYHPGVVDPKAGKFLTNNNIDTVIDNYKWMLAETQPDIIGIEEYEETLPVYESLESDNYTTIDMDEAIFNPIYPNKIDYIESEQTQRVLKSKFIVTNGDGFRIDYKASYPETGTPTKTLAGHIFVVKGHVNIYGKTIAIVSTAFQNNNDNYSDDENLVIKKAGFQSVISLLENEEYAFIICDANASETYLPYFMENVFTPAGYKAAMGSYFPYTITWQSPTDPNEQKALDNVFYKGNMLLTSFKAYFDKRPDLASDHVPVTADFILF